MTSTTRPAFEGREERRAHPRIPADAVPFLETRIIGGPAVRLLDLSKRGVHIATSMHMRPGRTVVVRFLAGDAAMSVTSAVVRSSVAVLEASGEVIYHTALAFNDELTLCSEAIDDAVNGEAPSFRGTPVPAAADYTMLVMDSRVSRPESIDAAEAR